MKNKLEYSFDDEPISIFCYDLINKKIEIHFKAYFDELKNEYFEIPCVFVIEDWREAKSKVGDEEKLYPLNKHIGVFSMLLYMKYNENNILEILVNTLDNRYITLFFEEPNLYLKNHNFAITE